ncbi:MAG: hypothetical protein Q9162_004805 [Coniocarpon cinnabarinum]
MDFRAFSFTPSRPLRPTRQPFSLRRWSRDGCDASIWDGIRRDFDLYDEEADCSVFLYAKGQSQRGPAFRLPSSRLVEAQCTPLLDSAHRIKKSGRYYSQQERLELYLPAPAGLLRQDAFRCHTATRNFFAWLCGQPLVGHFLGDALAGLLDCMRFWRDSSLDNVEDILIFADRMGYSAVEHCPDHALAMLAFADKARLRHVWIDAFAHCTGMHAEIVNSGEYNSVHHTVKDLIAKAHSEMNLHLNRTSLALVGFLEHELSDANLGLSEAARQHLDSFRSFLQAFYVGRFGYWPPYQPSNFPRELYHGLYDDFSCLYHLLANRDILSSQGHLEMASGGICVEQNLNAFNLRHGFNALPHTLPLVPESLPNEKRRSQVNFQKLGRRRGSSVPPMSKAEQGRFALRVATNCDNDMVMNSDLVQKYLTWEEDHSSPPNGKASLADARKVRWILIYGFLQMLVSALQAPPEVRDTTTVSYPLCISTHDLPPWNASGCSAQYPLRQTHAAVELDRSSSVHTDEGTRHGAASPTISIRPDCETQTYSDYWANSNSSSESQDTPPKPTLLKRSTTKLRKTSARRKSLPSPQSRSFAEPELVSGRTLAELVYGEGADATNDFHTAPTDFDFGFEQQSDESPRHSTERASSTFDGFCDSLAPHRSHCVVDERDDGASIPSLTFSHRSSRGTVDSFPSDRATAVDALESWRDEAAGSSPEAPHSDSNETLTNSQQLGNLPTKLQEAGHEDCSYPYIVSGFTDLFAKIDTSGYSSDDSSVDDSVDRAAVIESDGALTQTTQHSHQY